MTHRENIKILAFVGMPGAGKSEAALHLSEKGLPRVYFGGILYDAMREKNIEITPSSQAAFREKIRAEEGNDFVVKRGIQQINNLIDGGQRRVLIDGLYTWDEYKILKHEFPGELTVVAILAPRNLRHRRLANRAERPFTAQEARDRDWSQIENMSTGGPIAIADYSIINDKDLESLHKQVDKLLQDTHFIQ